MSLQKKCLTVILLLVLTVGMTSTWLMAGSLVAPRQFSVGDPPAGLMAKKIALSSYSGATVKGWDAAAANSKGVVILLHGLRASRISMQGRAKMLQENGFSSVLIDFQGHGESKGESITVGSLERYDVNAAIEYARAQYPGQPVAIVGISMGGAATVFASPQGISAVVLESVYPDLRSAIHNRVSARLGRLGWLPAEILLWQLKPRLGIDIDELRPIDQIKNLDSAVFIISGEHDPFTTVEETRSLYNAAADPKELWIVKNAAHENLQKANPDEYNARLLAFLNRYM